MHEPQPIDKTKMLNKWRVRVCGGARGSRNLALSEKEKKIDDNRLRNRNNKVIFSPFKFCSCQVEAGTRNTTFGKHFLNTLELVFNRKTSFVVLDFPLHQPFSVWLNFCLRSRWC